MTPATVRFKDGRRSHYARCHLDGSPETVPYEIDYAIGELKNIIGRIPNLDDLFDIFINKNNRDRATGIASWRWHIVSSFHWYDEYRYLVEKINGEWIYKKPRRRSYKNRKKID